jgi:hypothetical protein
MAFLTPVLPEFDTVEWAGMPFAQRARLACVSYAVQGWGSPAIVYVFYAIKIVLYVAGWSLFCSFTPGAGDLASIDKWEFGRAEFEKAVLWSMMFEGLGFGCGSGPLSARFFPPFTAFLHFLRPGTTKRPLFAKLPVLGGYRRTWLDVGLYAGAQVLLLAALLSSQVPHGLLIAIALLYPVLALADKTIFLSARGEHYWAVTVLFALSSNWIPAAKALWIALWLWAGISKLTPHFTSVVCVMTSNAPATARMPWLRKLMYRRFPVDLRPSRWAGIAHGGAGLEFAIPIVMLIAQGGTLTKIGLVMMVFLHCWIASNVPPAVPLEWNVMMIYGGFFLFSKHAAVSIFSMPPACALFLFVMAVLVPLLGNLFPSRVSFLMAMRYYAGNWPFSIWLFQGESHRKLDAVKKVSKWVPDQVAQFYDERAAIGVTTRAVAFRLLHLQGRALPELIPKAVDRFEEYTWADGELICGMVLGWSFGDGHLSDEEFLTAVQEQCQFEPGELRVIMVEAQPLGRRSCNYRIHDASTGKLDEGNVNVADLKARQPWGDP